MPRKIVFKKLFSPISPFLFSALALVEVEVEAEVEAAAQEQVGQINADCQLEYGCNNRLSYGQSHDADDCVFGVFRCDNDRDANLVPTRKDVEVFSLNFNQQDIGSSLVGANQSARRYSRIAESCGPDGSPCLVTLYRGARNGSARQSAHFRFLPGDAYTLQYDVKFSDDFDFVRGGKLHGLGPQRWTTGCHLQVDDGWSARVMWRKHGIAELYIYDQTRVENHKTCGWSYRTTSPVLKRGVWQALSLYVNINSLGESDGEAELWIDGHIVVRKSNIKYRGEAKNTRISEFGFSTFFGGNNSTWAPDHDVSVYTDIFRVVPGRSIRLRPGV